MVEIMEYLLVFAVTLAIAGFSVVVFTGSLPVLHETQGQEEANQMAAAVGLAARNGTSSLVVPLSQASVACSGDTLALSSGGETYTSPVSAPCAFSEDGLDGMCTLDFSLGNGTVSMEVQG